MTDKIQVIAIGSIVGIGCRTEKDIAIMASVIQICIGFQGVEYEVAWWADRVRHKQWISSKEVLEVEAKDERTTIGFIHAKKAKST